MRRTFVLGMLVAVGALSIAVSGFGGAQPNLEIAYKELKK
jgi:hypothetical protein